MKEVWNMKGRLTLTIAIALTLVALAAISAWAVGTPAGTVITNTAILNYKDVNGNSKQEVTDSVTTTVATKRGVDVSPATHNPGTIEDKVTEYAFTITNTGNATDTIALSIAGLTPGWSYEILFDADGDGVWDSGEETDVTSTGALLADGTYKVIVRVTAPATEDYNGSDTITLTATSSDTVTYDTGVITIDLSSANVSMTKVESTTTPVPLADFTYTITVTNSDLQTAAYNVVVTDVLDTDLVWVSNSTVTGSASYNAGNRTVTWTIGTLPANTTATLTITVHVGEEVPEGSSITNTANLAYEDYNGNDYDDSDSSEPGSTQELADVDISTAYMSPADTDPGDVLMIPFSVQNTGNGTDSFDLSYTDGSWDLAGGGTVPITWTFYVWTDLDNDGVVDDGEVGTTPVTNTGDLTMNSTAKFVAVATVPTDAAYTASSTVTITATSTSDMTEPYTTDSITVTHNVKAPVLTLDKAVDKASAQPGETLTYTITITNVGDGLATGVVLVDAIPANTTYVAGSITLNGPGQTDAKEDDYADYNWTNAGAITVTPPNMAPGDTVIITFQVTIN